MTHDSGECLGHQDGQNDENDDNEANDGEREEPPHQEQPQDDEVHHAIVADDRQNQDNEDMVLQQEEIDAAANNMSDKEETDAVFEDYELPMVKNLLNDSMSDYQDSQSTMTHPHMRENGEAEERWGPDLNLTQYGSFLDNTMVSNSDEGSARRQGKVSGKRNLLSEICVDGMIETDACQVNKRARVDDALVDKHIQGEAQLENGLMKLQSDYCNSVEESNDLFPQLGGAVGPNPPPVP